MMMHWRILPVEVWDYLEEREPKAEYDFIRRHLEQNPGRALEVGCGTGHLLLRYLRAGLDVEGVDTAEEMLAMCRAKAAQHGLQPVLYQQAMEDLALPNRYRTIFVAGGLFMLITDRAKAWEALRRFYKHLEPGGTLLFSTFDPFGPQLDAPLRQWQMKMHKKSPNGSDIFLHAVTWSHDEIKQLYEGQWCYQVVQGEFIQKERYIDHEYRWYHPDELALMLKMTGFHDIVIKGDYTDEDFKETHKVVVLIARRPAEGDVTA